MSSSKSSNIYYKTKKKIHRLTILMIFASLFDPTFAHIWYAFAEKYISYLFVSPFEKEYFLKLPSMIFILLINALVGIAILKNLIQTLKEVSTLKPLLQWILSFYPSLKKLADRKFKILLMYFILFSIAFLAKYYFKTIKYWWFLLGDFISFIFVGIVEDFLYQLVIFLLFYTLLYLKKLENDNHHYSLYCDFPT